MAEKTCDKALAAGTLAWIEKHPELIERLGRLRQISEDSDAELESLEAAERAVIAEIDRLGGEALRQWLDAKQAKAAEQAAQNEQLRRHSKKKLRVTTLLGGIEIDEQVFQQDSRTVRPLCLQLDLVAGGYSKGLQEAMVDFGAEDSFELAAQRLSRHHPVQLCAGTMRKITFKHARRIGERQRPTGCLGSLPAQGAANLIGETDGTMLPVVEFEATEASGGDRRKQRKTAWREARLCAVRDQEKAQIVYACDMDGVDDLGYRWSHCAGQAGWGLNSHIHVVSDGAAWIGRQVEACFGGQAAHLLDLYHVMEYLSAAQKAHLPWMNPRKRWLQVQKKRLLGNHSAKVLRELSAQIEPPEQEHAPIRDAWRYLHNHLDQLDYKSARERALPVGSGMIEGGHRHVLQKRLKLSGAWWCPQNLDAMTQLRTCRANNQWDDYWRDAA